MKKELEYIMEYRCDEYSDEQAWKEFQENALFHQYGLFGIVCETTTLGSFWVIYRIVL